jgi:predicted nucleic acid-binding protein
MPHVTATRPRCAAPQARPWTMRTPAWSPAGLERWLREVEVGLADRILPITLPVAAAWGRQQHAQPLSVIDGLIAATAKVNNLTVVTRNAKDFERTGVQVLNPFGD